MSAIRQIYLSVFILSYKIGEKQWPKTWQIDLYRGVVGLSTTLSLSILAAAGWLLPFDANKDPHKLIAIGVALLPYIANAWYLVYTGAGERYVKEFGRFHRFKQLILYSLAIAIVVGVGLECYFSASAHRRGIALPSLG